MSLVPLFRDAVGILDALNETERTALSARCLKIRRAEAGLSAAAAPLLQRCLSACEGLCCRNIVPDTLIDSMDFVFILGLDRTLTQPISLCLEKEDPLYGTACIFLNGGVGPCLFPGDLRPQVCITSFCTGDHIVRTEIATVKWAFFRMEWFVRLLQFKSRLRGPLQSFPGIKRH